MIRGQLRERLPAVWTRFDREYGGVASGFVDLFQQAFESVEQKGRSALDLKSLDRVPDQYLRLLAELVGYRWRNQSSYRFNRRRTKRSIPTYSYKGTLTQFNDIIEEYGSLVNGWTDQASKLLILSGGQGQLSTGDCGIPDADYLNDGVWIWALDRTGDIAGLIAELDASKPLGVRWYYDLVTMLFGVCEVNPVVVKTRTFSYTNANVGILGNSTLSGTLCLGDFFETVVCDHITIVHRQHSSANTLGGALGYAVLGGDLNLGDFEDLITIDVQRSG